MRSLVKSSVLLSLVVAALFAGQAAASDKVDVNTADAATIDRVLVNIGPSKAEAIVAHREANGPYKSLEQLANVKGIVRQIWFSRGAGEGVRWSRIGHLVG